MNKNFKNWLEEQETTIDSSTNNSTIPNDSSKASTCDNCGKDFFKNWYYTKTKKRRKNN